MRIESTTPTNRSDWIVLSGMSLPCVVGIHDWERRKPQVLVAEIGMALDLDEAASGDLAASVDYAAMLDQVELIALHGRWRLLESMVATLARHLLSQPAHGEARAQVDWVRIKVTKPDIFGGRAVPSVELLRDQAWRRQRRFSRSGHDGVKIESLTETPDTGAYHVSLEPGAAWPLLELSTAQSVAGTLSLDERRLAVGERFSAPGILRADQGHGARVVVIGPRGIRQEASHV
jgi:7,8-dihydroneopterin aldolase/epimerase/oxygenase